LHGGKGPVYVVTFSPDGKLVAAASWDEAVRIWDAATAKEMASLVQPPQVKALAFSPDGKNLVSASSAISKQSLLVWYLTEGKQKLIPWGPGYFTGHMIFSPDGKTLAATGQEFPTITVAPPPKSPPTLPSFTGVKFWDVATGKELSFLKDVGVSDVLAFSPDGKTLAVGSGALSNLGIEVKLWEIATGKVRGSLKGEKNGSITCLAFTPDGTMLAAGGGAGGTVQLWNTATGKPLALLAKSTKVISTVTTLAFSPDGTMLAAGSDGDGAIALWSLPTTGPKPEN
jgi:WD40 repeat protein